MQQLHSAAKAPIIMKIIPYAHPQSLKTYGKLNTPDPTAEAHNEKILPLKLPFPNFEKVLSLRLLVSAPGDIGNSIGMTYISAGTSI